MKLFRILAFALSLVLLVAVSANAQTTFAQNDACHLSYLFEAWARPAASAMPNSAVYGHLVHIGEMPDTLVSASSEIAEAVELHEMVMGAGDVMQMRPVEGGIVVPANGFQTLEPGGLHVMLIGLKQELVPGDQVALTLHFEHAGDIQVMAPVRDMDAMAEGGLDGVGMHSTEMGAAPMMWDEACVGLHFLDAWARPSVAGAPNSAAYGLLVNLTDEEDTLIAATTEAAEVVELHEMVLGAGDVMQMRPIESGIVVPAGGAALLKRGGLHIMLINLKAELMLGELLDLRLTFASGVELIVTAPVREPDVDGAAMQSMGTGMGGMHSDSGS
ncbi:MAG: copper chaperone PCu(A)C [Chloroflexi bacterium]|nr:copper chaperone PCu(A)C [Chloroflexota bacterium]